MEILETINIGVRYRLTDEFDVYNNTDCRSGCRRMMYIGEEFTALAEMDATRDGVAVNYRLYKVITQSGDIGYVGCLVANCCVNAEQEVVL